MEVGGFFVYLFWRQGVLAPGFRDGLQLLIPLSHLLRLQVCTVVPSYRGGPGRGSGGGGVTQGFLHTKQALCWLRHIPSPPSLKWTPVCWFPFCIHELTNKDSYFLLFSFFFFFFVQGWVMPQHSYRWQRMCPSGLCFYHVSPGIKPKAWDSVTSVSTCWASHFDALVSILNSSSIFKCKQSLFFFFETTVPYVARLALTSQCIPVYFTPLASYFKLFTQAHN